MTENNKEKDSFEELVDKAIEAYRRLLNNNMALDLIKVQGSLRSMIIKDPRYIKETKAIKAEKYINELEEVERVYNDAKSLGSSLDGFGDGDGRDGAGMSDKQLAQAKKDSLMMVLKATEERRALLALTSENAEDNEDSAINFFFCPVSREEMERMKRVEIFDGTDDDKDVLEKIMDEDDKKAPENTSGKVSRGTRKRAPEERIAEERVIEEVVEKEDDNGTIIMED